MFVPASYLRRVASTPAIAAFKRRSYELLDLSMGSKVLDVGCGPGTDTCAMGLVVGKSGRVLGIDSDLKMVADANMAALRAGVAGWTNHCVGQITSLPIESGRFDACRSERVFQHLTPAALRTGISEMARVTRGGGRLAAIDTDWGSLSIDSTEPGIERRLVGYHINRFPNPYAGKQLYRAMKDQGLVDVTQTSTVLQLDFESIQFHLEYSSQLAVGAGVISPIEAGRWWSNLAGLSRQGKIYAHVVLVMATGQAPTSRSDGGRASNSLG
jgi:SAM-dependent methyltransferase